MAEPWVSTPKRGSILRGAAADQQIGALRSVGVQDRSALSHKLTVTPSACKNNYAAQNYKFVVVGTLGWSNTHPISASCCIDPQIEKKGPILLPVWKAFTQFLSHNMTK